MIKIVNTVSPFQYKLTLTGHAEYDKSGNDIVCAAISALVQTLAYSVVEHGFDVDHINLSPGNTVICIHREQEDAIKTAQAEAIWSAIILGIETIAKQYKKNINYRSVG